MKIFKLVALPLLLALSNVASAINGFSPEELTYKNWANGKPHTETVVGEKQSARMFFPGGFSFYAGLDWRNSSGDSIELLRFRLCELTKKTECAKPKGPDAFIVQERYLGSTAGYTPLPVSNGFVVGAEALRNISFGGKKIIHLRVSFPIPRDVVTVAFDDDIDDNDLRQIALEEGIYRALRWNE